MISLRSPGDVGQFFQPYKSCLIVGRLGNRGRPHSNCGILRYNLVMCLTKLRKKQHHPNLYCSSFHDSFTTGCHCFTCIPSLLLYFLKLFYLFTFDCAGSLLLCRLFSPCSGPGSSLWWCGSFSLRWFLLLWSMGFRGFAGSVVAVPKV